MSETQGGGETVFPALGLSVEPKRGRLLLFEDLLPDGTCDPRTAHASSDLLLNATADKLVVQKQATTTHEPTADLKRVGDLMSLQVCPMLSRWNKVVSIR